MARTIWYWDSDEQYESTTVLVDVTDVSDELRGTIRMVLARDGVIRRTLIVEDTYPGVYDGVPADGDPLVHWSDKVRADDVEHLVDHLTPAELLRILGSSIRRAERVLYNAAMEKLGGIDKVCGEE